MNLREATPADDEAIARCIGQAFPGNPKARVEVLRWQYRDNPFGSTAGVVWDDEGEIVGHYSAYPMPYLLDGASVVGANAVDAAIAPTHQGRRLFTPMAKALYEACAEHGMPVAVCYATNEIAMRGVAKAGVEWRPRLRTAVLATDDGWLARRFHVPKPVASAVRRAGFGLGRGPAGDEVAGVPDAVSALWDATKAAGGIVNGVDRGEAWWRWRYEASPLGPYRFFAFGDQAAAVVVEHEDFGGRFAYVLELLASDAAAAKAVLRAIVAGIPGLAGVATVAVDDGPLLRLATAAGLRTVPVRFEPRSANYGLVATDGRPLSGPWHVGWGDMDHL
jgi:RimJ/RimL family protein N-acetyltransferase